MRNQSIGRMLALSLICGFLAVQPQSLFAQGNSLFTGSGTTKGGTGGITGTLGGSGFGTLTGGTGASTGLGSTLSGANAFGGNGASGATGFGATGANGIGGTNAASGFVGRNSTTIAGNSRAGQTANSQNAGRNNSRNNNNGNFQSQNSQNNNSASQKKGSSIRPRQKVAFEFNAKSPAKIASTVTTRIDHIGTKNPALKQVGVQIVGDAIVLSGRVKTREQSRLAENILRLEPGVKTIRNELEVEQDSSVE